MPLIMLENNDDRKTRLRGSFPTSVTRKLRPPKLMSQVRRPPNGHTVGPGSSSRRRFSTSVDPAKLDTLS
ncbi:hypothetical protein RRG08_051855 [Elysia crispata]|uniref:Uncharacterized protein n=1 Tax=Elysia crispata TaxID=231223 RepID=A0AAE0ZA93_9GAST|nr:hypothetical protein RRG08_051855 [Elysia crispata]